MLYAFGTLSLGSGANDCLVDLLSAASDALTVLILSLKKTLSCIRHLASLLTAGVAYPNAGEWLANPPSSTTGSLAIAASFAAISIIASCAAT